MSDEETVDETVSVEDEAQQTIAAQPKIAFKDQKEFDHKTLKVKMILKKSASEMVQRDLDKFMKRFSDQTQGKSPSEDNGKTVRAAMRADWIETLITPQRIVRSGNDVDEMHPSHVRWAAEIIDLVYTTTRSVPNE